MSKTKRPILAEGEVTGHAHVLDADVGVLDRDGLKEFELQQSAEVVHEEHKPITVAPGKWVSGRAQEWDHFAEEAKQTRD